MITRDMERRGILDNLATDPRTSAPPLFNHHGNIDGDHPPADLEQHTTSYYETARQNHNRYHPSPTFASPYDPYTTPPPPLPPRPNAQSAQTPPRPNAQSAQTPPRNAISANYPQHNATTPFRPSPASYNLHPIVTHSQTVQNTSRTHDQPTPELKATQWTEIRPAHVPYYGFGYGSHMGDSNKYYDPLSYDRQTYSYLRTKDNPNGKACKTECTRKGCRSWKAIEMAEELHLPADEWHEYSARLLLAGVGI